MKRLAGVQKRNFRMLMLDALFWGLGFSLASPTTILPAFAVLLAQKIPQLQGRINILGTLLFAVFQAGLNIPPILGAFWTRGRRRVLPIVLWMVFVQRGCWLVMAAGIWIWGQDRPLLVLALLVCSLAWYAFFSGAVLPPWMELYARIVSPGQRGRVSGLRNSLVGISGMICLALSPRLLEKLDFPVNYSVLFTASSLAFIAGTVVILRIREVFPPRPQPQPRLRAYLSHLASIPGRDSKFRAYMVQQFIASFRGLANPALATLKLATSMGLSGVEVTSWSFNCGLLLGLSSLATGPFWGRLADYWGHRRVQGLGLILGAMACLSAVFARTPQALASFFVLFGISNSGMMVSIENMTLDLSPAHERPAYVSLRLLSALPGTVMTLVGGWMADRGGYSLPLILSAVIAGVAVFHLWTRVPDPRAHHARGRAAEPDPV